ncbi:MAG: UDP-glucose dehydrogenase family protein [Candidatus Binatia bacterium]
MSSVAILGTGYVGLVTGACLADLGHTVVCVDRDRARLDTLAAGKIPFHEPGLLAIVDRNRDKRLTFTTELKQATATADFIVIAVGTPNLGGGGIDLSQVEAAVKQLSESVASSERSQVLIVKSTVIPGTTDGLIMPLLEAEGFHSPELAVVVNPEFLTEGSAVDDFLRPDRIVVGSASAEAAVAVAHLMNTGQETPVIVVSAATAEMIKYASNTLLATMISFANEISELSTAIGDIDITEVMKGVHTSRYLTSMGERAPITAFLEAGCGFGGSCLPKDTAALVALARSINVDAPLLKAVLAVNTGRANSLSSLISEGLGGIHGRRIGVLGLAFKPDTDDVRESPAFPLIRRLLEGGAIVHGHDPVVSIDRLPPDIAGSIHFDPDLESVLGHVEAVVITTRWDLYRQLPQLVSEINPDVLVVDGRRMLDHRTIRNYDGVGFPRGNRDRSDRSRG